METRITITRADPRDPAGQQMLGALVAELQTYYDNDGLMQLIPDGVLGPGAGLCWPGQATGRWVVEPCAAPARMG